MDSFQKIRSEHIRANNTLFQRYVGIYDIAERILVPSNIFEEAVRSVSFSSQDRVLDVASGTGVQAFALARHGLDVVGIDCSPDMLKQARDKAQKSDATSVTFIEADATEIPFDDDSFDSSFISFGLHEMPGPIALLALQEIKRVTKDGGAIIVIDYLTPKESFISRMLSPLISIYESSSYKDFCKLGIEGLLYKAGLPIQGAKKFRSIIRLVKSVNTM